jgi:hypothetical protein
MPSPALQAPQALQAPTMPQNREQARPTITDTPASLYGHDAPLSPFQRSAIAYCQAHSTECTPADDGAVVVHTVWWLPGTDEHGTHDTVCTSVREVRNALGY